MRFLMFSVVFFCSFVNVIEGDGILKIHIDSLTQESEDLEVYCDENYYLCGIQATFCVRFGESAESFSCTSNDVIINMNSSVHIDNDRYLLTDISSIEIATNFNFNGTFEIYSEITTYNSPGQAVSFYDAGHLRASIQSAFNPKYGIIHGSRPFNAVIVNLRYELDCSPGYAGAYCNSESNNSSSAQPNNGSTLAIASPLDQSVILINLTMLSYKIVHCLTQGEPTEVYWLDDNLEYASYDSMLFLSIETIQNIVGLRRYHCYAENSDESVSITVSIVVAGSLRGQRDILADLHDELLDAENEFGSEAFDSFNDYLLSLTGNLSTGLSGDAEDEDSVSDEDYEVLDEVSSTYNALVQQFTQRYNILQQRNITERLLNTANGILRLSIRQNNQTQGRDEAITQTTSMTYSALEYLSTSIADNLEHLSTSEVFSIAYDSIHMYGRSWYLSELGEMTNIRIPDSTEGEQVEIPIELVNQFRTNANKFSITTTVVNTQDYFNSQETDTGTLQLASRTIQLVLPTNYSINNTAFSQPVKISFNVTSLANSTSNFTCVFLNSTTVEWSTNGISNGNTTNGTVDCYTTHLTNFAVLVSPKIIETIGTPNYLALTIMSYILGISSFILLVLSLILFLAAWREFFKKESNIIYFNCCLAMLFAMGLYVFASDTFTFNLALCKAVAFLLHYTWLTVFAWTFCIGLLLLHTITLGTMRKYKIYPWLLIIGWICPMIIPIITLGIGYNDYLDDNPEYCFLKGDQFYAFFVPAYTAIVLNFVIFCFTLVKIFYAMKRTSSIKNSEIRKKTLITGLTLTPILGLPWGINIIGFFWQHSAISWVHVVLNGSIGISFFFIVVVLNEEVQALFCKSRRLRKRTLKSKVSTSQKLSTIVHRPRARTTMRSGDLDTDSPTSGSSHKISESDEAYFNQSEMEKNEKFVDDSSSPSNPGGDQIEPIVMIETQ